MKENSIDEDMKKLKESIIEEKYHIYNKDLKIIIERFLSNYKRVLKENEELKNQEATQRKINELLVQRYSNSIPVQKIKDKIKEIQEEGYWLFTTDRDSDKCVEVLQQLLGKEQ